MNREQAARLMRQSNMIGVPAYAGQPFDQDPRWELYPAEWIVVFPSTGTFALTQKDYARALLVMKEEVEREI